MRRAACTSGMVSSTAAEVTKDLAGPADATAILRMQQHAPRAQKVESFGVASLVERAIRTLDPSAAGLDDQSERGHATTADAAKKVISWGEHRRNLQAPPMKCNAGGAMSNEKCRIAVVAPASRISPDAADKVRAVAGSLYPDGRAEIFFHPQCFMSHGHFAGDDEARARAFLDVANDDNTDAVWFARGGYGSCRMVEAVIRGLKEPSRRKTYLGYSDTGTLLAALYRVGFEAVAHGPMVQDIQRDGGEAAIGRALAWMVDRAPETLEPTVSGSNKTAAFNITILSQSAWHAAATRPRRPCADAGGGVGGDVPDRPVAVSHHQQSRDQAGRGHQARPLQRYHREPTGLWE